MVSETGTPKLGKDPTGFCLQVQIAKSLPFCEAGASHPRCGKEGTEGLWKTEIKKKKCNNHAIDGRRSIEPRSVDRKIAETRKGDKTGTQGSPRKPPWEPPPKVPPGPGGDPAKGSSACVQACPGEQLDACGPAGGTQNEGRGELTVERESKRKKVWKTLYHQRKVKNEKIDSEEYCKRNSEKRTVYQSEKDSVSNIKEQSK